MTSYLVYLILGNLRVEKKIALISAIFFLIAGSAYEPIIWIAANLHSFATLFILLTIFYYQKFLANNKSKHFILTCIFFILALNTKEIAFITLPLMLATYIFYRFDRKNKLNKNNKILLTTTALITLFYTYFQYSWQKNSSAISSGYWQIDFAQFYRWPIIIMDTLLPLFKWLNNNNHTLIYVASLIAISILVYYLRKSKLFWYGSTWLIISSLPTIFAIDKWWMPLASRYTYLPKIGMIFILAVLIRKLYKKYNTKIINIFLIILFAYNTLYWINIANKEYPYVYQSGRSLKEIVKLVGEKQANMVYMIYPFPFEKNNAHVVSAFSTLIDYPEHKIIFIDENDIPKDPNGAIIRWNSQTKKYSLELK